MNKKRLGKGLKALIKDDSSKDKSLDENIKRIKVDLIEANPYQPRKEFKAKEIKNLSQSIKENGLIQPILVRKKEGKYQVVAGERRLRAVKELDVEDIEVVIKDYNEQQMMEVALVENLQRQDLNPIEEAKAYQKLVDSFNLSQAKVAAKVAKSRSAVANMLRLLKLPKKIQDYVSRETIKMGHARALLGLKNKRLQLEIVDKIINNDLTVREIEQLVKELKEEDKVDNNKEENEKNTKKSTKDPQLLFIEDKLRDILGTKINIQHGKNKGKIVIEYYSEDDLNRIISHLK